MVGLTSKLEILQSVPDPHCMQCACVDIASRTVLHAQLQNIPGAPTYVATNLIAQGCNQGQVQQTEKMPFVA